MSESLVLVERHEGYAEIVLNRPERRNSIIAPMSVALKEAVIELAEDDAVSCLLIRGADGYFCSGVDLKALQADPPPPWRDQQFSSWRALHLALFACEKPVIGALESYAINAGAALALACDLLVTGSKAFLQVGEIQQGARAPMNAAWLRLKVPEQVAARLVFMGDRVAGEELYRLGLATACVPDDDVLTRARALAAHIAGFPPGASRNIKLDIIEQRGIEDPESYFRAPASTALLTAGKVK